MNDMIKRLLTLCLLALLGTLQAYASPTSMVCNMKGINTPLSFIVPSKMGEMPKIEFDYPVNVTRFSFRSGNLLLIAMDESEKDRPRVIISAQLNQKDHAYQGQFMTDFGGNELQLDNGRVSCILK
jgi:hypothetical protein